MASVALEGVSKVYSGGVTAVDDLNLRIGDREFVVLVGPSGCGKSTTLRMIAGLEEATAGTIRIGERVVNEVAPKDRDIAMVFQNYALYPHMTVYRNLAFGLQLRYGGSWLTRAWRRLTSPAEAARLAQRRQGIRRQVGEAARLLGIEMLLDRMPRQLSGGERQRVALGRAIVRHPAAFLFDEPLSNLDAKLRVEMRRELKQLHRRLQATMVYVTHDQVEALTLGERIVVMDRGRIQQVGTPREVYAQPRNRFVAGFVGSPPMNFIEGCLVAGEGVAAEPASPLDQAAQWHGAGLRMSLPRSVVAHCRQHGQTQLVLGVRPEQVRVGRGDGPAEAAGASVALVEALGDSTLVHLELAGGVQAENNTTSLIAKVEAQSRLQPRDAVWLAIDPPGVHWFDVESGAALV